MTLLRDVLPQKPPGVVGKPPAPIYTCKTCNDLGFVRENFPLDHPLFGRLIPCPDCSQRAGSVADEYGLLPADRSLSWEEILPLDSSIDAAKVAIQQALAQGHGWVYLWGGYGVAKTAILKVAVAVSLRNQAAQAVYLRMSDLMDDIRSAYDAQKPQVEIQNKLRWFTGLPLLAIDEFEKVSETGFVEERRFQVLDARYEAATRQHYGITLIGANVPPEKLPGALASRINDERFTVVHITASDMRLTAKGFEK